MHRTADVTAKEVTVDSITGLIGPRIADLTQVSLGSIWYFYPSPTAHHNRLIWTNRSAPAQASMRLAEPLHYRVLVRKLMTNLVLCFYSQIILLHPPKSAAAAPIKLGDPGPFPTRGDASPWKSKPHWTFSGAFISVLTLSILLPSENFFINPVCPALLFSRKLFKD